MQAEDFYYYFYNQDPAEQEADYMSWNTPYAHAGVSGNWNWGTNKNPNFSDTQLKYDFTAKPSIGLDLGVVYEFRPKYQDYQYDMDGETGLWRNDLNKYLLKVGVSVLDIGRLKYEKMYNSYDFTADFTSDYLQRYQSGDNSVPMNTHWMDIEEVELGYPPHVNFADTIYQRAQAGLGTARGANDEETLTIKLPTAFSLQADVKVVKGLYVNLTTFTALNQGFSNTGNSHYISNYSVTPRYEHKWFGVSVPMHFNQLQKFNVGLGIRAAFLYMGINNLFSSIFSNPYGTSVYFGVKIPIWHKGPPADRDGDAVSDARDKCIDTPGIWEFMGCPDTDGDGIPDMDDKCPKDPGPTLTQGCPDRDNDGVLDNMDQCPDTPGPAQFNGCPDSDGDGIRDEVDRCPNTPGTEAANGCPDRDNDGVADMDDACPDQFGKPEYNGCPFQDSDGDGIMDDNDLCPKEPGPPENNGCPWTDTDGDGVWDKDDRCPLTPGDPQNFGCPIIKTEEAEIIKTAFENLEFETNRAVIRSSSFPSLDELAGLLNDKPNWKLKISGHTDSVGNDDYNMGLSKKRAEATAKYLQGKGIAPNRFIVEWFGETQPIADNATAEGRQKNRRVEMEIVFD
jgi:outer membrane protein OmpA-like peptidoglycan-associated protein